MKLQTLPLNCSDLAPVEKSFQPVAVGSLILLMIYILHFLKDPKTMGIMVYSLLWVIKDAYHQPYQGLIILRGRIP